MKTKLCSFCIFLSLFALLSNCSTAPKKQQQPCICKCNTENKEKKKLSQQELTEQMLQELQKINKKLNSYDITITSN